jgi:hypothetical protein
MSINLPIIHSKQFTVVLHSAVLLMLCLAGCQRHLEYTGKVRGTVTLDGKPMTSGNVISTPRAGGRGSIGPIQSDGSFALMTGQDIDGVAPGAHQLAVVAYDLGGATEPELDVAKKLLVPEHYADPGRSGFTIDVIAGEEHRIELKLVTNVSAKE